METTITKVQFSEAELRALDSVKDMVEGNSEMIAILAFFGDALFNIIFGEEE